MLFFCKGGGKLKDDGFYKLKTKLCISRGRDSSRDWETAVLQQTEVYVANI